MARLIRTDALLKRIDRYHPDIRDIVKKELRYVPTVKAEPTEKQVEEYCHKRCLVVVDSELFNEMKARWSEDCDYEHAVEQLEHDMTFEPTYNPEDGSM